MQGKYFLFAAAACFCTGLAADGFPAVWVSNNVVQARSYLPGRPGSYYRGTRFVRCSMADEIKAGNTRFYGRLFHGSPHEPEGATHGCGPAEEFDLDTPPPGFTGAAVGGTFLKIGVGVLRRTNDKPYNIGIAYEVADPGVWQVETLATTGVVYRHTVKTPDGRYGTDYRHTLATGGGSTALTIRRSLTNTGTEPLVTRHYNHQFLSVDNHPAGPDYTIRYSAPPLPIRAPKCIRVEGNDILFTAPPQTWEWCRLNVDNLREAPNRFRLWHGPGCTGVDVETDRPVIAACFFASPQTICPEMFTELTIAPGETETWTTTMTFLLPR